MAYKFAWICEYLQAFCSPTFKVMQSKKFYKVVLHKHLKFCFHKFAKKFFYCAISCADFHFFANCKNAEKS